RGFFPCGSTRRDMHAPPRSTAKHISLPIVLEDHDRLRPPGATRFSRAHAATGRRPRAMKAVGMGGSVRPLLRLAARPGRRRAKPRPRRALRHRLAGHPAVARESTARSREHIRPAALRSRPRAAAAQPRPGFGGSDPCRMAKAAAEMSHWAEYDYVVVN